MYKIKKKKKKNGYKLKKRYKKLKKVENLLL